MAGLRNLSVDPMGLLNGTMDTMYDGTSDPDGEGNSSLIDQAKSCVNDVTQELLYATFGVAVIVAVIFSFTQKRRRLCRKFCFGLPSVSIPIDLIQSRPHRAVYLLIFGAISGDILYSFFNDDYANEAAQSQWATSLVSLAVLILQVLVYFPLFIGVNAPIPILGYSIGFFYCMWLIGIDIQTFILVGQQCSGFLTGSATDAVNIWTAVLVQVPVKLCQMLLTLWFGWKMVKEFYRLWKAYSEGVPFLKTVFECEESTYHYRRVKSLLKPPEEVHGCLSCLKCIYEYDPNIQYPLRFLSTIVVMMNMMYILTLAVTAAGFGFILPVLDRVEELGDTVDELTSRIEEIASQGEDRQVLNINITNSTDDVIRTAYSIARDAAYALAVIFPAGPLLGFLWNTILVVGMVFTVHKHLLMITKGDYSFLPEKLPSPTYRLVSSLRYCGYQIAYFMWAWILMTLIVWVAGFVGLLAFWLLKFFTREVLYAVVVIGLPLCYSFGIYYLQVLMVKLFFVGGTKTKHTVLKNRRFFHWTTYVLYFQNIYLGLTSALLRIIYAITFGLLLFPRLDRVVLMKGLENFDAGHKTYIGFLYLEHTQNNSVLNVFVSLLLDVVKHKKKKDDTAQVDLQELVSDVEKGSTGSAAVSKVDVSRRAANRWLVAYTLLRNEDLQKLTATRLEERREKEEKRKEKILKKKEGKKEDGEDSESEVEGEGSVVDGPEAEETEVASPGVEKEGVVSGSSDVGDEEDTDM